MQRDYRVNCTGLTIASERPRHRLMETWHPLGVVGVISAFNFPVAVWVVERGARVRLWRCHGMEAVGEDASDGAGRRVVLPTRRGAVWWRAEGLLTLLTGGRAWATALVAHPQVPLVSATGSTAMGRVASHRN